MYPHQIVRLSPALGRFVALVVTLLLGACIAAPAIHTPSSNTGAAPSILRIGRLGSPDSLNPGVAQTVEANSIFQLVYEALFNLDLDGAYTPVLAKSYKVSEDGKVWTFQIVDHVKFHDGEPLTAHDVAFSYNLYKDNIGFTLVNPYTEHFEAIAAPDDSTVVITLTQAIPSIENSLASLRVLPEHIWAAHSQGSEPVDFLNEEMIGSGPFKLVDYKQNEYVHLAANRDYHLTPPQVDEVIFQSFANDDALGQALKTGQVDMITQMPTTAVAALRNAPNVKVVTGAPFAPATEDIAINQLDPQNCPTAAGGLCTGHPALRDRAVRLALAYATDKQQLIDVMLLGLGKPGLTLIPDGLGGWYNPSLQDYGFNIAKANQILDEAGYKDTDGDGVREMPDGAHPLDFRLYWPTDATAGARMAELLGQNWSKIGVKTEPQAVDPNALIADCCPGFDFDIFFWSWSADPDPAFLLNLMHSSGIAEGNNESGYANPAYDALFKQQAEELDHQKRQEIVWEMQKLVHDDVVYIIPYYPEAVQAYRSDRFSGWLDNQPRLALEDVSSLVQVKPVK